MSQDTVRFNDLAITDASLKRALDEAVERVMRSGRFILGPEVEAFEAAFRETLGAKHGIGVASGTDAISLSLMALGVGPGDEVITSPLTAAFTGLAITRVGATPVFADVDDDTLTLSPGSTEERLTARTRAVVPVHLYGSACDMDALLAIGEQHGLSIVEDACQAHGGRHRDRMLGTLGHAGAFSFYPTKNLGGFGDGGFIATDDAELAAKLVPLRNGGQTSRYVHETLGLNSRLDELQAAVLAAKLPYLERENTRRRELAARYESGLADTGLADTLQCVAVRSHTTSARHLFVVRSPERDRIMKRLVERGVQTLVHYPVPVHLQPAYRGLAEGEGHCPVAERAAGEVFSLPLYPALRDEEVDTVIETLRDVL